MCIKIARVYVLEGKHRDGETFKIASTNVKALQEVQTDELRRDGSGYIRRL